jgi:tetratricopeptide (TPR) repeat protein
MLLNDTERPDQAPPACEDAFNIFMSAGNKVAAADCVRQMADTLGTQGHYERAIETYQRALNLLEGLGEHEKTGSVRNNMAIAYENEGKLDSAEQLYRAAKAEFERSGDLNNEVTAMGNIADIYYLRGNLKAAVVSGSVAGSPRGRMAIGLFIVSTGRLELNRGGVRDAHRLVQQSIDSYLDPWVLSIPDQCDDCPWRGVRHWAIWRSAFPIQQTLAIRQKMGAELAASQTALALWTSKKVGPSKLGL